MSQAGPTSSSGGGGGGGRTVLSTQTASNSAALIFSGFVNASYSSYELSLKNIQAANGATVDFLMQLSQDNASTYVTADYDSTIVYNSPFALNQLYGGGGVNFIKLLNNIAILGATTNGVIKLYNLSNASFGVDVYGTITLNNFPGSNNQWINDLHGSNYNNTNFNAFKIYMSTGNILSGTATLYGITDT